MTSSVKAPQCASLPLHMVKKMIPSPTPSAPSQCCSAAEHFRRRRRTTSLMVPSCIILLLSLDILSSCSRSSAVTAARILRPNNHRQQRLLASENQTNPLTEEEEVGEPIGGDDENLLLPQTLPEEGEGGVVVEDNQEIPTPIDDGDMYRSEVVEDGNDQDINLNLTDYSEQLNEVGAVDDPPDRIDDEKIPTLIDDEDMYRSEDEPEQTLPEEGEGAKEDGNEEVPTPIDDGDMYRSENEPAKDESNTNTEILPPEKIDDEEIPPLIDDGDMYRVEDEPEAKESEVLPHQSKKAPTLIDDGDMYRSEDEPEAKAESEVLPNQSKKAADVPELAATETQLKKKEVQEELEEGEVASDSTETDEPDVQQASQDFLKEAENDMTILLDKDLDKSPSSAVGATYYPTTHRSAWVAHGAIGFTVFAILVPSAISSAFFRDLIPTYWIYIHVCINVMTFAMTFFTVGIAFATMNGMGDAGEGHMKELHHIGGLMLLLLVSFQTANGFLRPPREFLTDDEHDTTPGAILRSTMKEKSMTTRTLWWLVHCVSGLAIFALGTYQVQSGLGLFAKRYDTPDWGQVYVGYVGWLAVVMLIGKVWMKWKERKNKLTNMGFEMGRGSSGDSGGGMMYDPENDLTVAQFETV